MVTPSSGVNRKARHRTKTPISRPLYKVALTLLQRSLMDRPRRPSQNRETRARADRGADEIVILYGWHPVVEALRNARRPLRRLLATENSARRLEEAVPDLRLRPELVRPGDISRLVEPDAVHQGLYLEADPLPSPTLETLPAGALVLALDQITDPHNVGAIVRTGRRLRRGCHRDDRPSQPVGHRRLGEIGVGRPRARAVRDRAQPRRGAHRPRRARLRSGSDLPRKATRRLDAVAVRRPLVVVLGAEGKGLRQRTKECCDVVGRLDMPGEIKSLNVSNATAITLYALTRNASG